jgi:hypothetical protein
MSMFLLADGTYAGFDKHRSRFFGKGLVRNTNNTG